MAREATGKECTIARRPGARPASTVLAVPSSKAGTFENGLTLVLGNSQGGKMDRSAQQLFVGTFAYLLATGGLVATLGAAFGT